MARTSKGTVENSPLVRHRPRGRKGAARKGINSWESRIGRLLAVELNHDEFMADADLVTLTLLLPRINLEGNESSFETLAIQTTHLFSHRKGHSRRMLRQSLHRSSSHG